MRSLSKEKCCGLLANRRISRQPTAARESVSLVAVCALGCRRKSSITAQHLIQLLLELVHFHCAERWEAPVLHIVTALIIFKMWLIGHWTFWANIEF